MMKINIEVDQRGELMASNQGKTAILFIHGILGTTSHFEPFLPLVPPNWSICNLLLKGHGGCVKDFSRASMMEWKQQVKNALEKLLETNNKVIIVAHSMGTLFAMQEATEKPVDELFLVNVPLKVRVTFRLFRTSWRVFTGKIKPDDKWSLAAQNAYSIERDNHILRYFGWIPRYLELFSEIRKTRKIIGKLSTPSHIYLSMRDEMVSPKCSEIFKDNSCICVKLLKTSGHFYYSPEDQCFMNEDFIRMIQRVQSEISA